MGIDNMKFVSVLMDKYDILVSCPSYIREYLLGG